MWINWSCRKQGKLGPNENLLWGIGNKKHKLTSCLLPAASSKENAGVFCCRTGTGRSWIGEAVALWSKAASYCRQRHLTWEGTSARNSPCLSDPTKKKDHSSVRKCRFGLGVGIENIVPQYWFQFTNFIGIKHLRSYQSLWKILILRDGCTSPHIVSHRVLCCMKVKSGKHCRLLSASSSTEVELPQCSVSLARN